jgi:hemin uptake protein HemP
MQDNQPSRPRLGPQASMAEVETPAATGPAGSAAALPRLDSRSLFRDGREVVIAHDGAEYRLRLTASGKLILTK